MKKKLLLLTLILFNTFSVTVKAEELPACYVDDSIVEYARELQEEYDIAASMLIAIAEVESAGKPSVISSDGKCKGLMQVSEIHNKAHENLLDPYVNMRIATELLAELRDQYGDPYIVLAHYHGESKVEQRANSCKWDSFTYSKKVCQLEKEISKEWDGRE